MDIKPNNIYNVDCYKAIKELPDKSIDCIYVDIPYLYDKVSFTSGGVSSSAISKRKNNNKIEIKDISNGIDYSIFDEFIRISKHLNLFIWCSRLQLPEIMQYFIVERDYSWDLLTWCKTNPIPSNGVWLSDIEYCLYFRERGFNVQADNYQYKSKWYISGINQKDKAEFEHPTIKPVELVKRHLENVTQPNDVVLDCFLGSGTTAVAAKELGRQYIGFEIDETYFQIASDRLRGISQQDRKRMAAGQQTLFDLLD